MVVVTSWYKDVATEIKWAWQPQQGPQFDAWQATWCDEMLFGGARGGGKSYYILGDFLRGSDDYGAAWNAIVFRHTLPQLEDMQRQAETIFPRLGGRYLSQKRTWTMPSGATLKMRYLENVRDYEQYHGHSYAAIYWDELTNWADDLAYNKMKACLRSAAHVKHKRIRATANPGGAGHHWVKSYFIDSAPQGYEYRIDPETKHKIMFIPSRVQDNLALMESDPGYVDRLRGTGSPELVRAWLEGDWSVIQGAFFPEFSMAKHVVKPFRIPRTWLKFRAFDWGSARPFCCLWVALSNGDVPGIPAKALVVYRELYGASKPNVGLKLDSSAVARMILQQQESDEGIGYSVADPACFHRSDGPSIAEKMNLVGVPFRPAANDRISGWDQIRMRLVGEDGYPMLYIANTCINLIRTLPAMQHDLKRLEDLDTSSEDHCFHGSTLIDTVEFGPVKIEDLEGKCASIYLDGERYEIDRCWKTRRNAKTVLVTFADGRQVRCTPDHKFLTPDGWMQAKNLRGKSCIVYQRPSKSLQERDIISADSIFSATASDCIGPFGDSTTAIFQRATTSTTKTGIGQTIISTISNCFPRFIIAAITHQPKKPEPDRARISNTLLRRLLNGIEAKMGANGTLKTISTTVTSYTQKLKRVVMCAAQSMRESRINAFVLTLASPNGAGMRESMTLPASVAYAANVLPPTNTAMSCTARANAQGLLVCADVESSHPSDVYCCHVPIKNAFTIEGGIVVHNCVDTLRYGLVSRPYSPPAEKAKPQILPHSQWTYADLMHDHKHKVMNERGGI